VTNDDLGELGADLYVEELIDHYKNPRNAGDLKGAEIDHDGDNPTCGDMVHAYAKVKDGKLEDIKFRGKGCAISQASADILYEDLKGKKLDEVKKLNIQHVQDLLGIKLRPARVKCADLSLIVIKEGIREFESQGKQKKAPPGFGKGSS
jgi:nitrogen fixation protein NifU and related proteins